MKITGIIVHGKHLGRTLGFPTANIQTEHREGEGADGVYAAWLYLDNEALPCMVNIGHHPTLPEGGRTVEAHIFHFNGDLYGRHARVETIAYLRGETKFPSPEALRQQLARDAQTACALLNIAPPCRIE